MINPNFTLFLWVLLILIGIHSILDIILGLLEAEKRQHYGLPDVLDGIFWLVMLMVVFLS